MYKKGKKIWFIFISIVVILIVLILLNSELNQKVNNKKNQEFVIKYSEKILKQFLEDYKNMPEEFMEKKYIVEIDDNPDLNKKYNSYMIKLNKWKITGDPSLFKSLDIYYNVYFQVENKQYCYIFFLSYADVRFPSAFDLENITNYKYWVISWSLN